MENLLRNLNSVEISYGDNALTSIIQIEERINDIAKSLNDNDELSEFEKTEVRDRLDKLVDVNHDIQKELERQVSKIKDIQEQLMETKLIF
jgi:hypothetical protein